MAIGLPTNSGVLDGKISFRQIEQTGNSVFMASAALLDEMLFISSITFRFYGFLIICLQIIHWANSHFFRQKHSALKIVEIYRGFN